MFEISQQHKKHQMENALLSLTGYSDDGDNFFISQIVTGNDTLILCREIVLGM